MEQSTRHILFALLFTGILGCIYFLLLLCNVPFFVTLTVSGAVLFFLYKWIVPNNTPTLSFQKKTSWLSLVIFTIGLALITKNALNAATKHGDWDAWAIWNFHAKYLASPEHWQQLFNNVENDHPDYPMGLPSIVAFFTRITSERFSLLVPFAISLMATVCAPAVIFAEFSKKNLLIASAALFLLAGNEFYVHTGVGQYADTLLGTFFLCAIVCLEHAKEGRKYITMSAAFLGCCIWTKNEGVILASLCVLFYANRFFVRQNIKYTLGGIALPLATFVIFKLICRTQNDMVSSLGATTMQLVTDKERYNMIYDSFVKNLKEHFPYLKGLLYFYLIVCLLRRKWPEKEMLLVLTCLLVYMGIYLISRYGLEWHLGTSQSRLMVQLMPAMVYVLGVKFVRKD